MEDNFFNLNDPFQNIVYERMQEYMRRGLGHDKVLMLIGNDFPYLENDLYDKCVNYAYRYYVSGLGDKAIASFKHVALLNSSNINDPIFSHKCEDFHLSKGEDLILAVMAENPLYLFKQADVHIAVYLHGSKIEDFTQTMAINERRTVYHLPLNITKNCLLNENSSTGLDLDIIDENTNVCIFSAMPEVFYGEKGAEEIFTLVEASVSDQNNVQPKNGIFCLEDFESLNFQVSLKYNEDYGVLTSLDGLVTINPSDSSDDKDKLSRIVHIFESFENEGEYHGSVSLFNIVDSINDDDDIPLYDLKFGNYTVNFYIWDKLIWTQEVEFTWFDTQDDDDDDDTPSECVDCPEFDALMDKIIRDLEEEYRNKSN